MKKYQKKQQKIQRSGHKRLMQEKRLVKLMHENVLLNNFNGDNDNIAMFNAIVNGVKDEKGNTKELVYDELDTSSKGVYAFCKKFIMMRDIAELSDMENTRLRIKEEMSSVEDDYTYDRLRKKYKEMGDKCNEFYKKLNENDESRKLFKLCNQITNVSKLLD
jgi:hypothetical protein